MTETDSTPPGPPIAPTPACPRCGALLEGADPGSTAHPGGPVVCPACLLIGAAERPSGTAEVEVAGPTIEALNAALDAYDVQVLLGQGGAGTVYRARHLKLDRLVAIKVLRPTPTLDAGERAAFAERFEREARMLAKLDHPHIVRIYDFGQSHDPTPGAPPFFYLVLEYVEGASLRDLLATGRLTPPEVLEFVPQICDALQAAHDIGIVHRDIKPENILVDGAGRVRIADFGLAKLQGAEPTAYGLTRTDQVMGTLHYMAPEQMRASGAVDHRADLFSLGVVLYEMLTGELPIGRFAPPSASGEDARRFDGVVLRALESDPEARYQAARELRDDVEGPVPGPRVVADPNESPVVRRHRLRRARRAAAKKARPKGASLPRAVEPDPTLDVSPGSPTGVLRSWVSLALLFVAYSMPWAWIGTDFGRGSLPSGGGFEGVFPMLGSSFKRGMTVTGFEGHSSLWIFEASWYLGLVAFAIATIARTLRWQGISVRESIPWAMTVFGFVLTGFTLVLISLSAEGEILGGLLFAFGIFSVSSIIDVAAHLQREQARAHRRRLAREAA